MDIDAIATPGLERETVRRLSRRSNARGLLQLGAHLTLLAGTGLLVWASFGHWWLPAALILHGIVLSFLFCALHESIHGTAFASPRVNEAVAWVCGAILMLPPWYFRYFHFAHHRYTQDPARDPELATAPPANRASWAWRLTGLPYWGDRLRVTLRHTLAGRAPESFVPAGRTSLVAREARVLWCCYGLVAAGSLYLRLDAALYYWVLPALLGQPFLRAFLMAEHTGCPLVADMLANTRTTRSNAVVRLIAWRMPYHAEHHSYPSVPFHALGALHALIGTRVRVQAPGYLAVHRGLLRAWRAGAARR
jgi:fatty acid desaturase